MKSQGKIPKELLSPSPEFLSASENFGLFWWHWEQDRKKLSLSPGLLEILGLDPLTFDHSLESISKNIHPDDVIANRERLEKTFSGESELYELEYRIRGKKGGWKWFYNRGLVLLHDSKGRPKVLGGIAIDISSQFKHLMAVVEEKEKLEFIFKNTNEAIIVFEMQDGAAKKVLEANKAAMDLFGRSEKDLNKQIPERFLNDDVLGAKGRLFSQIAKKGYARVEKKLDKGDGSYMWLDITAHRFNLTGQDLVLAIVSDKTANKRTEEALRQSEKLYRTLFEAADDRIGLFTTEQKPLLLNSAFYESLGYTREEYMGRVFEESVHPEDIPKLEEERKDFFKTGILSTEYRVRHKDGHYLHMSTKIVLIKDGLDGKDLILFIMRDISDRKQAMMELKGRKNVQKRVTT